MIRGRRWQHRRAAVSRSGRLSARVNVVIDHSFSCSPQLWWWVRRGGAWQGKKIIIQSAISTIVQPIPMSYVTFHTYTYTKQIIVSKIKIPQFLKLATSVYRLLWQYFFLWVVSLLTKRDSRGFFPVYFASCFSEVQILFCRVIHKVLTSQRVKSYLSFSLYQQTDEKLLNPDISYTMASKHP